MLEACEQRGTRRSSLPPGGTLQQLATYDSPAGSGQPAANGHKASGEPSARDMVSSRSRRASPVSSREMVSLQLENSRPRTGLASVNGMEAPRAHALYNPVALSLALALALTLTFTLTASPSPRTGPLPS